MSSNSTESPENICVVCFKNVEIFSIGSCDHMVCYECSTRMRVLCRQNECPICRQELPRVVFTYNVRPFNEIQNCSSLEDKKFKICFQNKKTQDAFYKLLEHSCSICYNRPLFKTFQNLYDHMKKQHDLYYCDLCVEHLRIFSSERQCYTYKNLEQHKRKGDENDRSHRGHPLCRFCDVRFMDNDCLYRHLRRDHLYCHFCDADGFDLYYSSYDYLQEHFRTEHYLCEEGSCINEKFTPVFRTDIDLKAHRASAHGRTLGKAAAKRARTLELQFTLKPRLRQQENSKRGEANHFDTSSLEGAVGGTVEHRFPTNLPNLDSSEFPSLPSGASSPPVVLSQQRGRNNGLTIHAYGRRNTPLDITEENFPVLGVYNDNSMPGTSVRLNINKDRGAISKNGGGTSRNVSIHVNHRSSGEQNIKITQDDFPSLNSNKKSEPTITTAKWAAVSSKNTSQTQGSSATSKTPKLNGVEDFPSLNSKFSANLNLKANEPTKTNFVNVKTYKNNRVEESKEKKASSVTIPVENNWSDPSDIASTSNILKTKTKKKKSKGNNIEEKSDTAKKKQNLKELDTKETKSETKVKSDKDDPKGAFLLPSSGETVPVKPLPKVEDWFEGLKKCESSSKGEKEKLDEFNFSSADVSSQSTKFNFTDFLLPNELGRSEFPKNNNFISGEQKLSKNLETKAPPGFDNLNGCVNNNYVAKPPPGFSADFSLSNGLTFTNSSGQSYSIPTKFDYSPPSDFEKRNQKLVSKVNKIISNDSNLDNFRKKSILFRQNLLSAKAYYDHCFKSLDEKGLQEVFPELLTLLPDINKQQELYEVYSQSPNFSKSGKILEVCTTCRQVVRKDDVKQHMLNHSIDRCFPTLKADQ